MIESIPKNVEDFLFSSPSDCSARSFFTAQVSFMHCLKTNSLVHCTVQWVWIYKCDCQCGKWLIKPLQNRQRNGNLKPQWCIPSANSCIWLRRIFVQSVVPNAVFFVFFFFTKQEIMQRLKTNDPNNRLVVWFWMILSLMRNVWTVCFPTLWCRLVYKSMKEYSFIFFCWWW